VLWLCVHVEKKYVVTKAQIKEGNMTVTWDARVCKFFGGIEFPYSPSPHPNLFLGAEEDLIWSSCKASRKEECSSKGNALVLCTSLSIPNSTTRLSAKYIKKGVKNA
jgi:hypothetical protein